MSREYKYLPVVQEIVNRIESNIPDTEVKNWAKNRMLYIDDNMRGNPGHSISAGIIIDAMTKMTDEELVQSINDNYECYNLNNQDIVIGTA